MKCEILTRRLWLTVLILLVFAGTSPLLCGQEKTQAVTKPLSLGVLIDTSAHQSKVIQFEQEAVDLLADALGAVATQSFVVRYGSEVGVLQDWSPGDTGLRTVSGAIRLDVDSGKQGRTLLYDALDWALLKFETRSGANSRVLIIIGEGNDAGSMMRYSAIKKRAQSAHVQCFVLLVADHNLMGGRVRHFGFYLYDLASATQGKAYDIERSPKILDKAIRDVLKRIR